MDKMEERTRQRILDLANLADRRGIITYTDFMNLNELNIFHSTVGKIPFVRWKLFGGYAKAERQLAAFIPDALYFRYDFCRETFTQRLSWSHLESGHRPFGYR